MGKLVSSLLGGDTPKPYNPMEDPAYVAKQKQLDEDRAATKAKQAQLEADQAEAKKRTEEEQRQLASQATSRARARRYGGIRALLSEERLNPEVGLGGDQSTLG